MSSAPVLTAYIEPAMGHAHYELIDGGKAVYADIPGLPGVYATCATVEACRAELREVLEEWVLLGLSMAHVIPPVDNNEFGVLS